MNPSGARAASGAVPRPAPGALRALGDAPGSVTASNVLYHGGPVMAGQMQVYVIFWEPRGSVVSSKFNMLIKRYFRDAGDSGLYANNAQYTDGSGQAPAGAELAGTFVDRSPYPAVPVLQDSDIRNEVTHAMSVQGWTPGITHLFFVYTALNESVCALFGCSPPLGSMCGYHFGFRAPWRPRALCRDAVCQAIPWRSATAWMSVPTATSLPMPRLTSPPMSRWRQQPIPRPVAGSAREASLMKSATKFAGVFGSLNAKGADVYFKGHPYILQKEWDNAVSGCVLTGP